MNPDDHVTHRSGTSVAKFVGDACDDRGMSALPAPDTNDSILDAGIDASGAAWRPTADELPLFHGTRESYARAISQHGTPRLPWLLKWQRWRSSTTFPLRRCVPTRNRLRGLLIGIAQIDTSTGG
jgi:hypothetical protein